MGNWIVVTSINEPTKAIEKIGDLVNQGWRAVVVGDNKTPKNWSFDGIDFLSIDTQNSLYGELSSLLPFNHYCRKNLGYLYAIQNGAKMILETDDDNIPYLNFGTEISKDIEGKLVRSSKWVNAYKYFTDELIWPRGISLKHIHDKGKVVGEYNKKCLIQQYLADGDPDVDAIYRLLYKKEVFFNREVSNIILDKGTWCPFNSQNTVIHKEAFHTLYLPSFVSFRMTDIWRSFVAQAALWHADSRLAFLPATVVQERNPHDLMDDFNDEVPGYLQNDLIITTLNKTLLNLDKQLSMGDVIEQLWAALLVAGVISDHEMELYRLWSKSLDLSLK